MSRAAIQNPEPAIFYHESTATLDKDLFILIQTIPRNFSMGYKFSVGQAKLIRALNGIALLSDASLSLRVLQGKRQAIGALATDIIANDGWFTFHDHILIPCICQGAIVFANQSSLRITTLDGVLGKTRFA